MDSKELALLKLKELSEQLRLQTPKLPTTFEELQTCDTNLCSNIINTLLLMQFESVHYYFEKTGKYRSDKTLIKYPHTLESSSLRNEVVRILNKNGFVIHNGSLYFLWQSNAIWLPFDCRSSIIRNAFSAIRPACFKKPKDGDWLLAYEALDKFCYHHEDKAIKAVNEYIAATAINPPEPPFVTVRAVVNCYGAQYSNTDKPALHTAKATIGDDVADSAYNRLKDTFETIIENGQQIFAAFTYLCGLTAMGCFLNKRDWRRSLLIYGRCKGTGKTSMCMTLGQILSANKHSTDCFKLIPKGADLGKFATSDWVDKLILDFDDNYEGKKIINRVSDIINSSTLEVEPKFCKPFTIKNYQSTVIQTVNEFPRNYDPSGLTTEKRFVWEIEPKEQYSLYDTQSAELRLIPTAAQQLADCWRDIQAHPERLAFEGLRAINAITDNGQFVENWRPPLLIDLERNLRLEHDNTIIAPLGSTKHFEQWANNRTSNNFSFVVNGQTLSINATSTAELLVAYFYSVAYIEHNPEALAGFVVGEALTIAYKAFGEGEPLTLQKPSTTFREHFAHITWSKQTANKRRNRALKLPTNLDTPTPTIDDELEGIEW